jgi:hypothetical protein
MYVSLQGKMYVATRDGAGNPGVFRFVGNVPEGRVALATDTEEHKESTSGQRLTDHRMVRGKSATLSLSLEEWLLENLALALYGATSVQAAGSVVTPGESFPNPVAAGDFVRLAFPKVSSVVIEDSAGTPAMLVLDSDYAIESADHGTIKILDPTGFTQPLRADSYSFAQHTRIGMFTQPAPERWLRFEGVNTEDADAPVLVELYRVRLDPLAELTLISEALSPLALTGGVLFDATKAADATLGQFGRYVSMV